MTSCHGLNKVAKAGGSIAGHARKEIESKTGRPVLRGDNFKKLRGVEGLKGKED